MKAKTKLIPILILLGFLILNPVLTSSIATFNDGSTKLSPTINTQTPPAPQDLPDWISVKLDASYHFNDTASISWYGMPRTGAQSPFNPLYAWTANGSIEGGVWEGNPGNVTITAMPWDDDVTALEIQNFLNYTMDNYVRCTSWPSLASYNFTEYENTTLWVFNDAIASHEEFLNTTFYLVNNATEYLMDGFNASGIASNFLEYRIYLEWNEDNSTVTFSYLIDNATLQTGDTYIFSLGRALGLTLPLNLSGPGRLTLSGPYNRMIVNGTPAEVLNNGIFPWFPIGVEIYDFTSVQQNFNYTIWFREPISTLAIARSFIQNSVKSPTISALVRGEQVSVEITVSNTGDVPFDQIHIQDVQSIEEGMFQLIGGSISLQVETLKPGENVTIEYTVMAITAGVYEYPEASVVGIDIFYDQYNVQTSAFSITIGNGLLPSELTLIQVGVGFIIIVVVILLLYRFRYRIF
ncbi:MAG: hypothetical protein ACFE89_08465 [Candidatus Hodarchaeota archaeon]